ncbi:peptidase P60 [Bifidobacterium tissieri]|uniref:Peptidase P60 n=2 Tax=Bifidobacterium tissieri TaxID=1630162 RepID=A0A261F8N0_9BIFI|nr:NlpC/P60 family protein [Bifidobacterium tissieri]OZG55428.1 peptidase P60 [Bifidobacterium tissieri]
MKTRKSISILAATLAVVSMSAFVAPAASAADTGVVTSSRSFKGQQSRSSALLKESTATSVDSDSTYGGIESLDVPQTKSQAEKDAEAAAAAAAAQAQAQAEAEAAARQQAAQQAQSASRSNARSSQTGTTAGTSSNSSSSSSAAAVTPVNGTSASAVIGFAMQFVGNATYGGCNVSARQWDCSCFVQYVYSQVGVSLPRTSGAQATVGTAVPSLDQAQPGDIIANSVHAGIYIGDGKVVNSLNSRVGTAVTPVNVAFTGGYSIRRVL